MSNLDELTRKSEVGAYSRNNYWENKTTDAPHSADVKVQARVVL